jgi:hypothetical protein
VRVTVIATGFGGGRRRRRGNLEATPVSASSGTPEHAGDETLDVPSFLRNE